MTNEELLEVLNKRFDAIESRLERLEESAEVTRDAVNKILEWTDEVTKITDFPLPKVQ